MDAVQRIYSGYGEHAGGGVRAGKQGLIEAGGNAYLERAFPKLDYVKKAVMVSTDSQQGHTIRPVIPAKAGS